MAEEYLKAATKAAANNNYEEANKFIREYYNARALEIALEQAWEEIEEMERRKEMERLKEMKIIESILRGIKLDSDEQNLIEQIQSLSLGRRR